MTPSRCRIFPYVLRDAAAARIIARENVTDLRPPPGRAAGAVFQQDAASLEVIADAIRFLEILGLARGETRLDRRLDLRFGDTAARIALEPRARPLIEQAEQPAAGEQRGR